MGGIDTDFEDLRRRARRISAEAAPITATVPIRVDVKAGPGSGTTLNGIAGRATRLRTWFRGRLP